MPETRGMKVWIATRERTVDWEPYTEIVGVFHSEAGAERRVKSLVPLGRLSEYGFEIDEYEVEE